MNRIPIAQPHIDERTRSYVMDCLETGWVSSHGRYIELFEAAFAAYCGVKHAISTNNGTTALHLALVALGTAPGDDVIVPTVTYIATANAVRYCGANPVLVDVLPETLNIDPAEFERKITPKVRAVIPVHLYGYPAEMDRINETARAHGIHVVEDAAEAHGALYMNRRAGSLGDCGCFSFFGNKVLTTGEGGMVTTDDDELALKLRLYRNQGMDSTRRYWFSVVGYNYRMTNIQAAIGLAQLEGLEAALEVRRQIVAWYNEALEPFSDQVMRPAEDTQRRRTPWLYTILLRSGDGGRRDLIIQALDSKGIETRPIFHPMHHLPPYYETASYPVADTWAQRGISLPTHHAVSEADVHRIAAALSEALRMV